METREKDLWEQKMIATNDHAVSWDRNQISVTGIRLPFPANPG
jgi:hypothetical protein